MRILVLCYEYPPVGGGGGRIAAVVSEGLAARGHTVRVVTSHTGSLPHEETTAKDVSVRRAFAGRLRQDRCTVPEMAAYVASHSFIVSAEIARFKPDVIHSHFAVPTGAVAWLTTRLRPVPYVITAHLADVPGAMPEQTEMLFRFAEPMTRPIWHAAAASSAVAPHLVELAEKAYGQRPVVIRNGIDMSDAARAPQPVQGPVRVLWCGRMQAQKNLGPVLLGLGALADKPWTLDLIGDGPLRAQVEESISKAGLTDKARIHGWLPAERVREIFKQSHILFMPSLSEGLSLVTIEALRDALAIVGSRIPGIDDVVVDGENGILCSPDDPATYAQALAELIENPDRLAAMRQAALARAPLYDAERMIDAYEALLSQAAGASK